MQLLDTLLKRFHDQYILPEVAARVEAQMRPLTAEYASLAPGKELAGRLAADLRAFSGDKHADVVYREDPLPQRPAPKGPTPEQLQERDLVNVLRNGGFYKAERLRGNVGYLDLQYFAPPEIAGETAAAAMALLSGTEALIVDLRTNDGGFAHMVAMLCSYFIKGYTHLNTMCWRDGRTYQFWTLPHLPGERYLDRPVYLLTSSKTFSAAEEFAYNLQTLKRATIVGEPTAGGAHFGQWFRLDDHFEAFIPVGRSLNPITGSNWEGTGVVPDVPAPADQALNLAYAEALRHVIARAEKESLGPWRLLQQEAAEALSELA